MKRLALLPAVMLLFGAAAAKSEIVIGVLVSSTGPAASIGIAQKKAIDLGQTEIAGEKVRYVSVDEATDPTAAVAGAKRLIESEHVDIIIGGSTTPGTFAITDPAAQAGVPVITLAPTNALVSPVDAKRRWVFKVTPNDELEAVPLFKNMVETKVAKLALIGFSDPYGDAWAKVAESKASAAGVALVASERYARADTSVLGQVLKIIAAGPDAVLIAASGAPAALPVITLREKGFKGAIYATLGATFGDFRKLAGARAEGVYVPLSAAVGAEEFPDQDPAKKAALQFIAAYEGKYGPDARNIFAGSAWDALALIENAAPGALKVARPGTPEFREALRAGIENTKNFAGSRGVYNMSPTEHSGFDQTSLLLGHLQAGKWTLVK